jgi:glycosyltransferase involved in cell wall biosynthesis
MFVIDGLKKGGKERQLLELIKGLENKKEFNYCLVIRKKEIEYIYHQIDKSKIYFSKNKSPIEFLKILNEAIREEKPNIIHSWEGFTTFFTVILAKAYRIKVINGSIRFAKKYPIYNKFRIIGIFNFLLADITIANSFAGLSAFNLRPNKKYRVIHNGIDLSRFNSNIKSTNRTTKRSTNIGMIASFTKPKDYKTVIQGAIVLLNEGFSIKLYFYGTGPEISDMKKIIPYNLKDSFSFMGNIEKIEDTLDKLDICLLLSKKKHSEGISNSIMEYMASQKPVIATKTGGNNELIDNLNTGFLIPHEDKELLIKSLKKLILDNRLRQRLGNNGRERIKNLFSQELMVENYINLYHEMYNK